MKFFTNMKIGTKLPLVIVVLSLLTGMLTAVLSYNGARAPLADEAKTKLEAVLASRVDVVQAWLESLRGDIAMQSLNPTIRSAVTDFTAAWNEIPGDQTSYLQNWYIQRNPNAAGSKDDLDYARDGSSYSAVHAKYHPYLRTYLRDRGYYDIFLFDKRGNLVYSVFKETDYATNIVSGRWAKTDLNAAFKAARTAASSGEEFFFDLRAYGPSNDAPASFLSSPITGAAGEFLGVLVYQVPTDRMNTMMQNSSGLGNSGETYIVGQDYLMRSASRFSNADVVLNKSNDSDAVKAAISGQSGVMNSVDAEGNAVVAAFKSVEILGVKWGVIAEQDSKELFGPVVSLRNKMIIQLAISAFIIVALGVVFARGISRPLGSLANSIRRIDKGDYKAKVQSIRRGDEIGTMAKSLVSLRDNLVEADKERREAVFKSAAFSGASIAMMMIDRDLNVTYVNESTLKLFREHADTFRAAWPNFDAENIVGTSIDMFHKNPSHQRQILSDPASMPFQSDIVIGELRIELSISAVYDAAGEYVGNTLEWVDVTDDRLNAGMLDALDKSQATIEFNLDGTIQNVNEQFLSAMGYAKDEVMGRNHSMFVDPEYGSSTEYRSFWASLNRGEYQTGEFRRVAKGGEEIWIQASYNPIMDNNGKPFKVVKFATDVTEQKIRNVDYEGKIDAIGKAQAVIEFDLNGTIVNANDNFLSTVGYSFDEIKGKHHSMFVEKEYGASAEYRSFWDGLKRGAHQSGEFKRIGKDGTDIWIQASYNPILDLNGKPFKVVKFASDVTEVYNQRLKHEAEQKAQADVQNLVVTSLADGLQKLALGDLENRIDAQFSPEYEKLRADFNEAVTKLQETISVIVSTADGIRQGSGEISTATDDLSKRTENQAATLEQTAAALDEITATVKQSAESAKEANDVAGKAQHEAQESGEVVRDTVTAMGEIEKSAHQISQIIGVIDDIAFQTNFLALNAGVEAARAGDAGRGFAVVAQEVRALAQRSSDAAKEIKGLITTSSQHVESGVELVGRAGTALEKIVGRVESINGLVSNIAVSAKEQADSLSEANTAVNNMDQVTQQNASMVEETTAASRTLSGDANELMRQVAHFSVGNGVTTGSSAGAVAAASGGQDVAKQQQRVASFAASGSAALQATYEDKTEEWEDF